MSPIGIQPNQSVLQPMIYLGLSILASTIIVLIFRSFTNYKINSFHAIVFNYLTCTIIGIGSTSAGQMMKIFEWNGLGYAVFLGILFTGMFYLMARTTQLIGVTVTSVAQKLSFVIPVIAGILVFDEALNFLKIFGICLAILSVVFISITRESISLKGYFWMPFLVFAGSGVCDLLIKVIEANFMGPITKATFAVVLFGTAFLVGFIWMMWGILFRRDRLEAKSIVAGVLLGIPNYSSIYFLMATLQQSGLEASQVFPINNVGIILLSALLAWLIFNERLKRIQIIGLLLALVAIIILF